jgi:hypothetical protein
MQEKGGEEREEGRIAASLLAWYRTGAARFAVAGGAGQTPDHTVCG